MVQILKIVEVKTSQYIKSGVHRTYTDNLTKDAKFFFLNAGESIIYLIIDNKISYENVRFNQ